MSGRARSSTASATIAIAVVAGALGLLVWIACYASAPRYSMTGQDGNEAFFPVLILAAAIGGFLAPTRAKVIGLMLGIPALVLSPWTTPRADNDGLWVLTIPILAGFLVVLVLAAIVGARLRPARSRRPPQPESRPSPPDP